MQKRALLLKDPAKRADRNKKITEPDYKPDWFEKFTSSDQKVFIDGVLIVAGSEKTFLQGHLELLKQALAHPTTKKDSIGKVKELWGKQRDKFSERKNEQ